MALRRGLAGRMALAGGAGHCGAFPLVDMLPAFLTTVLFSLSVVFAFRSTRLLGSVLANFVRLCLATLLLAIWAHGFGSGLGGGALPIFCLSGVVGFGVGDLALYQALPRLGSRLSILMVQCLAAPVAAFVEWAWLGTRLTAPQMLAGVVILAGVALALVPDRRAPGLPGLSWSGIGYGFLAALGQAGGAVLSRQAYLTLAAQGTWIDGGTAAYQRIIGGVVVGGLPLLWLGLRSGGLAKTRPRQGTEAAGRDRVWPRALPWVILNSLAGPVIGVACYQWALASAPSGIVLPIVATTPLMVIPFSYHLENDRPGWRAWAGGLLAVAGAVLLTRAY
jgi:drug/metabolite transporter (DMT)-like permease